MTRILLSFMLAASAALAQTQSTPQGAPPAPPAATRPSQGPQTLPTIQQKAPDTSAASAAVPLNAPVLTIHGACSAGQKSSDPNSCTTIVTKDQFDKLLEAVNTNNQPIPPAMRRNLAQAYVDLMAFAQAAEKAGVANDPKFQELMKLTRMRNMAEIYRHSLEEKHRNPPQQEIQAFYDKNASKYEEVKLGRIFIPKANPTGQDKEAFEKKALDTANAMRERAVKGESVETLQKEAYTALGLTAAPPTTDAGSRRKGMLLPAEEDEIFSMKPGEISKVEQEPSGYIIYKLESRQTAPLAQMKDEISRELFRQSIDSETKSIAGSLHADFNDQYFGPPSPNPAGGPGGTPSAGTPPPGAKTPATSSGVTPAPKKSAPKAPPQ